MITIVGSIKGRSANESILDILLASFIIMEDVFGQFHVAPWTQICHVVTCSVVKVKSPVDNVVLVSVVKVHGIDFVVNWSHGVWVEVDHVEAGILIG